MQTFLLTQLPNALPRCKGKPILSENTCRHVVNKKGLHWLRTLTSLLDWRFGNGSDITTTVGHRTCLEKHVHPAYQHYTDAGRNGSVCSYIQLIQIGVLMAHLSERVPLRTWVQFPLGTTYDSYVKRVSQRSAESRGFSPGTPVSSHREC